MLQLEVLSGQVVGIIGPNGARQDTTFNLITGAYSAGKGQSCFRQTYNCLAFSPIVRREFANLSDIRLFADMTVLGTSATRAAARRFSVAASVLPARWANPAALRRAREVIEFFGLATSRTGSPARCLYGCSAGWN